MPKISRSGSASLELRIRYGFTLIEVAFSLLLVSVGVVSVLLILPMGVTAQVRSRQQTVATALAVNLIDMAYNQPLPKWLRTPTGVFRTKYTVEAGDPAISGDYYIPFVPDIHFIGDRDKGQHGPLQVVPEEVKDPLKREKNFFTARRYSTLYPDPVVHAPDLETILNTYYHGVFAVPTEIARRIDSQGDEIRKILDLGGSLYFIGPKAVDFQPFGNMPEPRPSGLKERDVIPDEIQNLVFAVVGFPQRNAELFCMDGMFPGYVDLRENFPRAIRLYPPTSAQPATVQSGADPTEDVPVSDGPAKQASVKPPELPDMPEDQPAPPGTISRPTKFGPAVHFNPTERCRQIVFWRVDWRSYSDCENASLAAADRYRYPVFDARKFGIFDNGDAFSIDQLFTPPDVHDPQYFRAERWFTYPGNSNNSVAVGGDTGYWVSGAHLWQDTAFSAIRAGKYGADLNGNRILDRGPTDPSRRLRAEQVARFNFYDPRVWLTMNAPLPSDYP